MAKWPLRFDGRRAWMTLHAIERYGERVRPHLDGYEEIHADAARLALAAGRYSEIAPAWVNGNWAPEIEHNTCGWLVCGDICLPLAEDRERPGKLVALTVLTRGGISDEARRSRNQRRSRRTHTKRTRGRLQRNLSRGPRPRKAFDAEST